MSALAAWRCTCRAPAAATTHRRRVRRRGAPAVVATAAVPPSSSAATPAAPTAAELKARIRSLAGAKFGHDLDASTRAALDAAARQLAALNGGSSTDAATTPTYATAPAAAAALTGTQWRLLYSTSTGNSSGKIGPFITDTTQEFPATEPGVYYNVSALGAVSARLRGTCAPRGDDRIDVEFESVALCVGGVPLLRKAFSPGSARGHWTLMYSDRELRVFTTNKGSLFVMGAA